MTPQRERVAGLRRTLREAERDGASPAFVSRVRALLAAEEAVLRASREPGANRTVAETEADAGDDEGDGK